MNLGQVYTKQTIADFMVSLLNLPHHAHIVDPCFGEGIFIKSLLTHGFTNITGVEVDTASFDKTPLHHEAHCSLLNQDFFQYEPSREIDGFILNPPYVRQEEINDMRPLGITKDILRVKCGDFNIPSKANLYLYFIARCVNLLKENGQIVAIFPNTWMSTKDGKKFFNQLITKGTINHIIKVYGQPFVENPMVDVLILRFTKGSTNCGTVSTKLHIQDDTLIIEEDKISNIHITKQCIPLSQVASIKRGITTGHNDFFINPPLIPQNHITKIISSPRYIVGYCTSQAQYDTFLQIGPNQPLSEEEKDYISNAEKQIIKNNFPKTLVQQIKNRKKWYVIPKKEPTSIVFPYIIRERMRFIYNDAHLLVRDNFYTIEPRCGVDLLMALLNNRYVYYQLEMSGKLYGKGLLKVQKYDVDELVIPNPDKIDLNVRQQLAHCTRELLRTNDEHWIDEATRLVSLYYSISDIDIVYKNKRNNRLQHG